MDHAHSGIEVIDHGDEDGFWGCGHDGGAPFEFALMREDDVFEAFEEVWFEIGDDSGFADDAIAEDDVALEDTCLGAFDG